MLKGYIDCKDINKLLIGYINFNLNKSDMEKIAIHLRNCPKCMEKYTRNIKRKRELNKRMKEIQKILRMQQEISLYLDNEASEDVNYIVETMLQAENKYKNELISYEKISRYLKYTKEELIKTITPKETFKIIAKLKIKEKLFKKTLKPLFQHVELLFRGSLKSQ